MKSISTKLELILWFKRQIWSDKNGIQMPTAFVSFYEGVFEEFALNNKFGFSDMSASILGEYMKAASCLLEQEWDRTITVSELVIVFIGDIIAEGLGNGGNTISFAALMRTCLRVLCSERNELVIVTKPSGNCLTASAEFSERHNIKVKVPMDGTEGFDKEEVEDESHYDI